MAEQVQVRPVFFYVGVFVLKRPFCPFPIIGSGEKGVLGTIGKK